MSYFEEDTTRAGKGRYRTGWYNGQAAIIDTAPSIMTVIATCGVKEKAELITKALNEMEERDG